MDPENPQGGTPPPAQITPSVMNPDGSFVEGWEQKYPKDSREMLSRFKSFDDLVTSDISLRGKFGHYGQDPDSLIQVPKEDSSDEVKAAFWKAAGELNSADDYKFERSKDISEKVELNDAKVKDWAAIAKKHHLSQPQFLGLANDWLISVGADIDAFDLAQAQKTEQSKTDAVAMLRKKFGAGVEERITRAEALRNKYGNDVIKEADGTEKSLIQKLEEENPNLKTSPWMRMLFDNIAESLSEDSLKGITAVTTPTTGQIDAKIAEVRADPAFLDRTHPRHKEVNQQLEDLYKKKHPVPA